MTTEIRHVGKSRDELADDFAMTYGPPFEDLYKGFMAGWDSHSERVKEYCKRSVELKTEAEQIAYTAGWYENEELVKVLVEALKIYAEHEDAGFNYAKEALEKYKELVPQAEGIK